jgi:hypothetical protein
MKIPLPGRAIRGWFLDRIASGPVQSVREQYDLERSNCPTHKIANVDIYGNSVFIAQVIEALLRLHDADPYGYSLVQRYIHAIEQKNIHQDTRVGAATYPAIGVRSEETTPEGRLLVTPERYAAFLVCVATHRRRGLLHAPKSHRADLFARQREQQTMALLLRARGF